jgi:non-specific serine/threonine protein kinase
VFDALTTLGWTVAFQRDWDTAEALLQEARQVATNMGAWETAAADSWLGQLRGLQGNDIEARAFIEPSIAKFRPLGDRMNLARCLCALADVALRQGRMDNAYTCAREALEISQSLGQAWAWVARAFDLMVRLAAARHQPERAVRLAAAVSIIHPHLGTLLSRMSRQDAVKLAEQELGVSRAAALWAEGSAMTREEAVAYALGAGVEWGGDLAHTRAWSGSGPLTPREREVSQLVKCGLTNRQIGEALVITEGTAALDVKHILAKLGVSSRAQIVAWSQQEAEVSTI